MIRKTWVAAAAVVLVVVVVGVVATTSGSDDREPANGEPVATATVERGPLSSMVTGTGILTHQARADGTPFTVTNRALGTYTTLPDRGQEIACGEVLYRVDERAVLLLCGAVPAYRDLKRGAVGSDVRQLNQDLHQLGDDAGIGIDPTSDVFTDKTEASLRVLQQRNALEVTGALGLDGAVFLPSAARIAEVTGVLGATAVPGAPLLTATSVALVVQVELDASQQAAVEPGDRAQVRLPGNTPATGKVERLGPIASVPTGPDAQPGGTTVGAYITLDHSDAVHELDEVPVQVEITTKGVDDALSVPVTAIFGRSGGGFAVEVVRGGGRRDLVAVKLGLFDTAGGRVQVDGDVRAGDRVVVPPS